MDKRTPEVKEKILLVVAEKPELREKWKLLAAELNRRDIKSSRNKAWKPGALNVFCTREHLFDDDTFSRADRARHLQSDESNISDAQPASMISDLSDVSETTKPPVQTEPSDASDVSETLPPRPAPAGRADDEPLPEPLQRQIRGMIRAEVKQLMELQTLQTFPTIPLPPEREKTEGERGRPVGKGERVKIGVTLDKKLFDRFEQQRKRLGLSASGFADVILWNFFGQPPMSYEVQDERESS